LVNGLFNGGKSTSDYTEGWLASNELEGMSKEAVEESFQLHPKFPGANGENYEKLSQDPPHISALKKSQTVMLLVQNTRR